MKVRIFPPEDMIDGSVELPVSKSCANRRMIIDAVGGYRLPDLPAEGCGTDIITLYGALTGSCNGVINVGNAGTAMRFLTAYFASKPGCSVTISGDDRMHQRPIGPLVEALRQLGAEITYAGTAGYPPLHIEGRQLRGGTVMLDGGVSSQFVSALMMIAPAMSEGLTLKLDGQVKSEPYIKLTASMMARRGADVEYDPLDRTAIVHPGSYTADSNTSFERDWSAMAFWMELTAITAGFITVDGLDRTSAQGDRMVMDLFAELGCVEAEPDDEDEAPRADTPNAIELCGSPDLAGRLTYDFSDCPDLAIPAIVTCCTVGIPFKATGLETLVIKETDRVTALVEELLKAGCVLTREAPGVLTWEGKRVRIESLPVFDARGDHRMAMALAPMAYFLPGIVIDGAECVAKSYPAYWKQLQDLGFILVDGNAPLGKGADE